MNLKKIESAALGYIVVAAPVASAAFAMDASTYVKVLAFVSGILGIAVRGINPKDPAYGIVTGVKAEVDAQEAAKTSTEVK